MGVRAGGHSGYARDMSACMRSLLAGLIALATLAATPAAAQPALTPPGTTTPAPPAPDWSTWSSYNARKKNEGIGVVLELFVPGLGSLYGDHWQGAATTWGLFAGGFVLVGFGIGEAFEDEGSDTAGLALTAGAVMIVGGRIYGLVDAYRSPRRYNRRLASSLGLRGLVLGPMLVRTSGQTTVGLGASWQF
jgi:hypothetical protein